LLKNSFSLSSLERRCRVKLFFDTAPQSSPAAADSDLGLDGNQPPSRWKCGNRALFVFAMSLPLGRAISKRGGNVVEKSVV
jgi:hypothetical protein